VSLHELIRCADAAAAAATAATIIERELLDRLRLATRASLAVSGGSSPWPMFEQLARTALDWSRVDVFQVDERIAPDGDPARNLTGLRARLGPDVVPAQQVHPMPVASATPAQDYQRLLERTVGSPVVLDVVHLGLGDDGHTASLVPGDPVLGVTDTDVATTGDYRGYRRVTLTHPALDRARLLVWLVTGADKAEPLRALLDGDTSIPAGRVRAARSVVVCDAAVAILDLP
jgi:6-phosphogluconolactonase